MAEITDNLDDCAKHISNGGLVSFPTETVYGLGASIYNKEAIQKIFDYKERPKSNPLIVHIYEFNQIYKLVNLPEEKINIIKQITDQLWPGPLTLVLPKSKMVDDIVTSGSEYIGIRLPDNDIAINFLKKCNVPIAAPSANKYCHVSPTHHDHVMNDFKNLPIKIIKNNKDTLNIGIESSIIKIDFEENVITYLRPGFITPNIFNSIIRYDKWLNKFKFNNKFNETCTPGSNKKHYTINKKTYLLVDNSNIPFNKNEISFIDFGDQYKKYGFNKYYTMSKSRNFLDAMKEIYSILRKIESDDTKYLIIYFPKTDNQFYDAIYNRLIKCSSGNIIRNKSKKLKTIRTNSFKF